jgi:NAD(P)-dependent dehydrogenase (short-subunit alcohol dehydrogenase family)
MDLHGKTAVVTGAGSGIGRELARGFGRAGARVVCAGRREAPLRETIGLLKKDGAEGIAVPVDVTDASAVQALVDTALSAYGVVDVLFANAGSFQSIGPVWSADPDLWWRDVTVNLRGTMLCCRAVLPHMMARNEGAIVTMDGGGGADGVNLGGSGYGASKAAIVRFTEGLARELEQAGSRVMTFCINPGFVRTSMTEGIASHPQAREWQGFVGTWLEAGKSVPPDACAKATLKLLSIASPELSGRAFTVDTEFEEVRARAAVIRERNLLVMRLLREEGPRGAN